MTTYETLSVELDEQILTVTLNRPGRLNAFTVQMGEEIRAALDAADADDAVRAVIFTGAGRAYCAGMDLSEDGNVFGLDETVDPLSPAAEAIRDTGGLVSLRLYRMKKPVIGAINGHAVGVGATMTLPMDARILSTEAKIGFVFARIGVCMEACSSWFLPRLVGMQRALDWAMSGEIVSAEAAMEGGYALSVVEPDELLPIARRLARRYIDSTSAMSVAVNRQLLWRMAGAEHPMAAHRLDTRAMFALSQGDGREGVASFREKRAPNFAGRISDGPPAGLDWDQEPPFFELAAETPEPPEPPEDDLKS